MKKIIYSIAIVALAGFLFLNNASCKGPQPCEATITVMDSAGVHTQANAKVHLWAQITYNGSSNYQGDLTADGTTNSSGQVSFTIKNPCILNVRATLQNCDSTHAHCEGTANVKFEEGQSNVQTVYINQ